MGEEKTLNSSKIKIEKSDQSKIDNNILEDSNARTSTNKPPSLITETYFFQTIKRKYNKMNRSIELMTESRKKNHWKKCNDTKKENGATLNR